METYDFSAFASGLDGGMTGSDSAMTGMSGSGGAMGGSGGAMGGFGSGMGGGTNSLGSGGDVDLEALFGGSPWGGLSSVGFKSLEQVFRGNAGGNLQRSDGGSTSGSANTESEGDSLLTGGEGSTSGTSAYSFNFSNFS